MRFGSLLKDILVFIGLIFLLSVLVQRLRRYIALQKGSLVHALDVSFFDTLNVVQRHAGVARNMLHYIHDNARAEKFRKKMGTIRQLLDDIERKYSRNAPSLLFLGPIGTTSIVLKEQELKQKLRSASLELHDMFRAFLEKPDIARDTKRTITLQELIDLNTMYSKEIQRILES